MAGDFQVTSSEGNVSSFEESSCIGRTQASVPWFVRYGSSSHRAGKTGWNADFKRDARNKENAQDDTDSEKQTVLPTVPAPSVVTVPYRGRRIGLTSSFQDKENQTLRSLKGVHTKSMLSIEKKSKLIRKKKKSSRSILQTVRPPLRAVFKENTPTLIPPLMADSDDNMFTPTASRSSSATSIDSSSSISPITPFARYQKRIQKDVDKESKVPACKMYVKDEYQQLLTKYFKARKMIRRLKDQNKYDQKKIALLEFSRQQDALFSEISETTEPQEAPNDVSGDNGNDIKVEAVAFIKNEKDYSFDEINLGPENEEETAGIGNSTNLASFPDLKEELVKRMAAVISDQSLRPIVFTVPLASPPSKMLQVMEKLSKSGNCCEKCGRMLNKKGKLCPVSKK